MNDTCSNSVVWKEEYNIGNFKIDKEHKHLFNLTKEVISLLDTKEEVAFDKLKNIVKSLFKYVSIHFKSEEVHMEKIKYPDIQNHKELHKKMISMLTDLIAELNSLKLEDIQKKIHYFMVEYFVNHIISEDKKIHLYEISINDLRASFKWKDDYKVENLLIDTEHKQLFDIALSAFEVVDDKNRNKKIKSIIVELYDYMKKHFSHEEVFMEKISYPRIEEHKKLHKNIIHTLNEFVKEHSSLDIITFEKELVRIIDISLVRHIILEDRKIMAWEETQVDENIKRN